jgi:hypothetical protein
MVDGNRKSGVDGERKRRGFLNFGMTAQALEDRRHAGERVGIGPVPGRDTAVPGGLDAGDEFTTRLTPRRFSKRSGSFHKRIGLSGKRMGCFWKRIALSRFGIGGFAKRSGPPGKGTGGW